MNAASKSNRKMLPEKTVAKLSRSKQLQTHKTNVKEKYCKYKNTQNSKRTAREKSTNSLHNRSAPCQQGEPTVLKDEQGAQIKMNGQSEIHGS